MNLFNRITINIFSCLLVSCIILCAAPNASGQKKERTRLKVYYEKLSNNDKKISMILTQGSGKKIAGVPDSEILLTAFNLDEAIDLATLSTDSKGEAYLFVESGYIFPKDEDGYAVINATYDGNDSLRATSKKIKFMDLNIDISFKIEDSIKLLTVEAFEIDSMGYNKPINEVDLNIGVERLYSTLFLEKLETDEEGVMTWEFPNDIPGDSIGTINVVVFVDDHDDYGTITKTAEVNWGTMVNYSDKLIGRSLFSDEAPVWMIISVFIILAGAWYHFMLAIFRLIKMRKLSSN